MRNLTWLVCIFCAFTVAVLTWSPGPPDGTANRRSSRPHRRGDAMKETFTVSAGPNSVLPGEGVQGRYVLYVATDGQRGQGLGNIMNGLASAMLLAQTYNRAVCVNWADFNSVFLHRDAACNDMKPTHATKHATYWNFGATLASDDVRTIFSSLDRIVSFSGNEYVETTFPQVKRMQFKRTFALRPEFAHCALDPRPCVAHLRKGDNVADARQGVDRTTLALLGEAHRGCHLITNNNDWYALFDTFGWSNPGWETSHHSVRFQMWSDWCTIMHAEHVMHTPSAFSESALRMSDGASFKRIMGNKKGHVIFERETWQ
jgi:hypothetical protein